MQYQLEMDKLTLVELFELEGQVQAGVIELDEENQKKLDQHLSKRLKHVDLLEDCWEQPTK